MTNLLNSLWQGAALTVLIWLLLNLVPRLSPATRYGVWWVTMLAVALLPLRQFLPHQSSDAPRPLVASNPDMPMILILSTSDPSKPRKIISHAMPAPTTLSVEHSPTSPLVPLELPSRPVTRATTVVWLGFSLTLLIRLTFSYRALHRLKRTASPPSETLRARLNRIAANANINRSAKLLVSQEITAPLALGFFRPAILIPPSIADESSLGEFDHMALHELAHLARLDDWANLLQQILLALLPIQPALFWIASHLNLEREAACDDRVIAITGTPKTYAASLTRIAELALWSHGGALASGVASNRSQLYRRIHRLLDRRSGKTTSASTLPLLAAVVLVVVFFSLTFTAPRLIALTDASPANNEPANTQPSNSQPRIPNLTPAILPPIPGTQIQTIPAQPGEKLSIDLDLGNVQITSWNQNQVQFKITQNGPDIQRFLQHHQIAIGRQDHEVSLNATGDDSTSNAAADIQYEITVPAKFDLRLKNQAGNAVLSALNGAISADIRAGNLDVAACAGTVDASAQAGNITLHGITAITNARASDGNIEAADCQSPLTLTTHNGNIDLARIAADVKAQTKNGNIVTTTISGAIDAATQMGNVEIRRLTGASVQASTAMGNIAAEIDATPKSDCSLATHMGNVELNLTRTAAVNLAFAAAMGNIDSDTPEGPVNGGGPEVRVSAQMGNVAVHRK